MPLSCQQEIHDYAVLLDVPDTPLLIIIIIVYMYVLLSVIVDKIPGYTINNGSSKIRK